MIKGKINNEKWYFIPILILGISFIYRLINQSKILHYFPLDITNDLSSLLAQLYFVAEFGFNGIVPYWYHGYQVLKNYAPGWFYFTLPLYHLTESVMSAQYFSMILMYILSFIFLLILAKTQKISLTKTILFFVLLFGNPITIGNFIRLGRPHSLYAFMILILYTAVLLWYKDHKLNYKFFLIFIPIYSLMVLAHIQETVLSHFLLLGLFLIKPLRDKIKIIIASIVGLIITSFWWVPYVLHIVLKTDTFRWKESLWLLDFTGRWLLTNIASIIIPLALFIVFYIYWKYNKHEDYKELIFYSPVLILGFLVLSRLIILLPILNQIDPDPYLTFFIFIATLLFVKIKYWPAKIKKLIIPTLTLLAIISVLFSVFYTPWFVEHTSLEINTLEVLRDVEGKFLMLSTPAPTSFSRAYYAYTAIYYNLSTPSGWAPTFNPNIEQEKMLDKLNAFNRTTNLLINKDCKNLKKGFDFVGAEEIITYDEHCETLRQCGLKKKTAKERVCLYLV